MASVQHLPYNPTADTIELADGSRWVREKTCHVVKHETYYGSFGCEEAGELWTLSCGDECINDSDFPPGYCPECGAEVVSADD